ncbi:hypothetical protein [Cohnella sp.]
MSDYNQDEREQENQTYDAQVAELAADMSEDDTTLDEFNEIEQNEGC